LEEEKRGKKGAVPPIIVGSLGKEGKQNSTGRGVDQLFPKTRRKGRGKGKPGHAAGERQVGRKRDLFDRERKKKRVDSPCWKRKGRRTGREKSLVSPPERRKREAASLLRDGEKKGTGKRTRNV